MQLTYNGIVIQKKVSVKKIISAFDNAMDWSKVDCYAQKMNQEMLHHGFPPISGYPTIISDADVGGAFLTGEEIGEHHIGEYAWKVTDGHHRSFASIQAELPYLETSLDESTITDELELHLYRQSLKS